MPITSTPGSINRADVLNTTWALVKKTGLTFGQALKKAWAAIKIKAAVNLKATGFFYAKQDGTERYAIGFNSVAPVRTESEKPAPANLLIVKYYDILAGGWRSFRIDRLIID